MIKQQTFTFLRLWLRGRPGRTVPLGRLAAVRGGPSWLQPSGGGSLGGSSVRMLVCAGRPCPVTGPLPEIRGSADEFGTDVQFITVVFSSLTPFPSFSFPLNTSVKGRPVVVVVVCWGHCTLEPVSWDDRSVLSSGSGWLLLTCSLWGVAWAAAVCSSCPHSVFPRMRWSLSGSPS